MSDTAKGRRRRSAWDQACTFTMVVTADQAELIARSMVTGYSIDARIGTFRSVAIRVFWLGLQGLRKGKKLGELQADPQSPVFAKLPEDFKTGPRQLTVTEVCTAVAEFMTEVYPETRPKEFQQAAERIMDLGLAEYAEMIIRDHDFERRQFPQAETTEGRRTEDRHQGQITYEEYCERHGIEPKTEPCEPRPSWPKGITEQPTPTADDLPDLFLD